jgi:hypothetical protein
LKTRQWQEYRVTRYYDGDSVLVVESWLHRVPDDLSGLTFQEWDPSVGSDDTITDTSAPVAILVNSSDLCAADFHLVEVRSLQLDVVARGDRRTCGATVRKLQGVGNRDVSEYFDTLGLVKSYFFKFFEKKGKTYK